MMGLFGKKKIEGKTAEEWFELAHSEKKSRETNRLLYEMFGIRPK
ncbi:MAG: hypothetical protein N2V75_09650 [Methanophagales archaeon]|nr:hypothetical protein [Methanophagales archaeon]